MYSETWMGHHEMMESRRVRVGSSFGYLAEVRTLTVIQIQSRQGRAPGRCI
jgi:hypothetical protein